MFDRIVLAIVVVSQGYLIWSHREISISRRQVDAAIIENAKVQIEVSRQCARVLERQ